MPFFEFRTGRCNVRKRPLPELKEITVVSLGLRFPKAARARARDQKAEIQYRPERGVRASGD